MQELEITWPSKEKFDDKIQFFDHKQRSGLTQLKRKGKWTYSHLTLHIVGLQPWEESWRQIPKLQCQEMRFEKKRFWSFIVRRFNSEKNCRLRPRGFQNWSSILIIQVCGLHVSHRQMLQISAKIFQQKQFLSDVENFKHNSRDNDSHSMY